MQPLLEIKDLVIQFQHHDEISTAVNKISFNVDKGKITALVGESGSGKSSPEEEAQRPPVLG